jgi:hypothetical protein
MTKQFTLAIEEMDYFLSVRITGYNVATDKITEAKILAKYPVDNEYTPFYTSLLYKPPTSKQLRR